MSDTTERLNAALEGRYQVEREIGEGGMATVFLAKDLKHNRNVALKVLKPELAAVVGADRFLAEIETTANLQHPHILPLFDSGEADKFLFYVMPYVEGETLRERIDRDKQLSVDEALGITTAVAGALQTAHEQGVIHRDIKPGNILMSRGQPLVADFGIAIAVSAGGGGRLTETGLSLGTPYYMSPEQATGDQAVGPASDTFALACVLYEMLTGEPPYPGNTAQAVLGKIIQGVPVSATAVRQSVPANVDAAIRKALEKLPADRFMGVNDFARALADSGFTHGETAAAGGAAGAGSWKRLTMITTATTGLFALAFGWSLLRPAPPVPVARFSSPFEEGQAPLIGAMAFTADGSALVYSGPGVSGQGSQLWIRRWADLVATPIRGTEDALTFVLSPDEQEVAFGRNTPLRIVGLDGGQTRTLVDQVSSVSDWSPDGTVFFQRAGGVGLSRVPSTGGAPEIITELLEGESFHAWLRVLPGGKMGVFQVWHATNGEDAEIWAIDLDSGERRILVSGISPSYASSGHLFFGTPDGDLMAVPINPSTAELTGTPVRVAESLAVVPPYGLMAYAISEGGTLAYAAGRSLNPEAHEFVWVTRSGEATPVDAGETFTLSSGNDGWRLSPDGSRIAFGRNVDGNDDIWIKTLPDGPVSRVTFSEEMDGQPQWAPDGRSVTYQNGPTGQLNLFSKHVDGTGEPELLFDGVNVAKGVWSPDGEWLVMRRAGAAGDETERDIMAIRPGVDSVAIPLVATPGFWEQAPVISRDGRWLAYSSNETGRHEVFVRPFPDVSAGKWQVSTDGGIQPVWAHNGRELFFADPETRELTVGEFTATSTTFQLSRLTTLFEMPVEFYFGAFGNQDFYDIGLDDERFLMARESGLAASPSLILVQNFFEELKRLIPN